MTIAEKFDELSAMLARWREAEDAEPSSSYDAELEYCEDEIAKLCIEFLQQGEHVLTHEEQLALKLTADLANALRAIIVKGTDDGIMSFDWQEAATLIHQIQHMIMSQAAGRVFPKEFRLLGSRIPKTG